MKKILSLKYFLALVCLFSSFFTTVIHGRDAKLENLQAAFIFKFTHYIEWPKQENKPFHIGVVDNQDMYHAIKATFEGKRIDQRPVNVMHLMKIDRSFQYNILHVKKINPSLAADIKHLQREGLLVISHDETGLTEESHINFYLDAEDKLRFEITNNSANLRGLKFNSRLLNLSRSSK